LTEPREGLSCPWDLACGLARAASLEQVAVSLTAALARHARARAAALLIRTKAGDRVVHSSGGDASWLRQLAVAGQPTAPGLPEPLLSSPTPHSATLYVPWGDLGAMLVLEGESLDHSWLARCWHELAGLVEAAMERVSTPLDDEQAMAILSHEMRTPLTSIKGYASSLLRDDVVWDSETVAEYARLIDEESDILIQMISEILEANAQKTGLLDVQREPVLIDKLARSAILDVERRDSSHVYIRSLPAGLPPALGDPVRLRQVLNNLLDNAIKYSSPGLVVVSANDTGNEIVVSVADEGPGLRPEHVNRLFERYFRVKPASGARRVAGTGLGLPLAREIIERLGGRIWATSEEGKGTTISFSIPKVRT